MKAILGKKVGMTQIFDDQGQAIPVTVIQAGPCAVVQRKTVEKDGYAAVQVGFGGIRTSLVSKPRAGHFKARGKQPFRYLREFRVQDPEAVSDEIKVDIFEVGQRVDVAGISKGKGYQGGMKRHNFGGGPRSHGCSKVHRTPMSTGSVDSARTFKGIRKPGQLGNVKTTSLGLRVVQVDPERNLLLVRGAVPGPNGRLVSVRESVKK